MDYRLGIDKDAAGVSEEHLAEFDADPLRFMINAIERLCDCCEAYRQEYDVEPTEEELEAMFRALTVLSSPVLRAVMDLRDGQRHLKPQASVAPISTT